MKNLIGVNVKIENGLIAGFEPKFKNLDADNERYLFAIVDLCDAGEIQKVEGQSLYVSHGMAGFDWLQEEYFKRELYDQIEAYYTQTGETFFNWPHEGELVVIDRFVSLGQAPRAKRLWRNHVALIKKHYWSYVDEKNRGFRMLKKYMAPEAQQRAEYEASISVIPEKKKLLLEIMAGYREFLVRVDASDSELARVDRDIADIAAERRTPPEGKPDPRPLDDDLFWEIVEADGELPISERLEAFPDNLTRFKPKTIRDFYRKLREVWGQAYRTDVWALAYLLRGGCSDDSFMGFRAWLILQGRAVFEATLKNPDAFNIELFQSDSDGCESILEAPAIAYELRAGKPFPPTKTPLLALTGPEIDEDAFAAALPRIAAALDA
jgi:hypothetical protein